MQTVLGAGGVIGRELAKALKDYTQEIRLVSRNPQKVNESDETLSADLLNPADVLKAVKGSQVVYLTVGFPYSLKIWADAWPKVMQNVIAACKNNKCKLVFFDNIYMYDAAHLNGMDENTPLNPSSKKGKIRADIAAMLMDEVEKGNLTALIARAADFYGPAIKKVSFLTEMVFKPLSQGKKAIWQCSADYKHSFTYTPDAGRATALLGNTTDTFDQIWHLPTADNPPTGKEWIEKIAAAFNVKPQYRILSKVMIKTLGFFIPIMKEMSEMLYQYDRDYVFNSAKFEKRFAFKTTSYEDGIKEIIASDY
jgi:nucleoside-diphosphate-sugar epimerase